LAANAGFSQGWLPLASVVAAGRARRRQRKICQRIKTDGFGDVNPT
jgi:hypothetical protein